MWEESDKLLYSYSLDSCSKEMSSVCPICGAKNLHFYYHRFKEEDSRGGVWAWCDKCRHYTHFQGAVPSWWKNPGFIDDSKLFTSPEYPDEHREEIDRWISGLLRDRSHQEGSRIVPFSGLGDITFNMSFGEVKEYLCKAGLEFRIENWPNKGCSPEVAWNIIRVGNDVSIFFAKNRMFKIYCENRFSGSLPNGIRLGMRIQEAESIDPSIQYDDWEEIYTSDQGYWLEDDVETGEIISITIFIKELEDDDVFFQYEWCDTY